MTVGIEAGTTDLDGVFALLQSGWPQASATGIMGPTGDLNTRYARLSAGSAAAATGIYSGSSDLRTIFAGAGTTGVRVGTQPSAVSGVAAAGNPSGTVTSGTTTCAGAGGKESGYTYTWHIASGSATLTAPSSPTCGVTGTVNAQTTDTGTMYCTISDGTTSVNTDTVGWSLQNTSLAWTYSGTLTAATITPEPGTVLTGFVSGTLGSISPTTIDGNAIYSLYTEQIVGSSGTLFQVTIASDPGQSAFTSLSDGGTTLYSSSASYSYSGGVARWGWGGDVFATPQPYSITIN